MNAIIFTTILGIVLLYLGFTNNKKILAPAAILGLAVTLSLSIMDWNLGSEYFHDMVIFDNFSIAFNASMIIITIFIFLFGIVLMPFSTSFFAEIALLYNFPCKKQALSASIIKFSKLSESLCDNKTCLLKDPI